jgi:hypothetical protein
MLEYWLLCNWRPIGVLATAAPPEFPQHVCHPSRMAFHFGLSMELLKPCYQAVLQQFSGQLLL